MTATARPALPVSDPELILRLLRVQDELSAIQDAAPVERHMLVDGVLVAAGAALARLGYEFPARPPTQTPDPDRRR